MQLPGGVSAMTAIKEYCFVIQGIWGQGAGAGRAQGDDAHKLEMTDGRCVSGVGE